MRTGQCPISLGQASALTLHHPRPSSLPYLELNGMFLGLQWGQVHAGWMGWGQEAKARKCEASSSIPPGTQVPCLPPLGASDHIFRQAAPMLLRELPLTLHGAHARVVSQAPHPRPPQSPHPAWGGAGTQGTGPAFLPLGQCPFGSCQHPLTLFSTALRPSWNDSTRCHTEVRCWPRMVTWEPLWRRAGWWASGAL